MKQKLFEYVNTKNEILEVWEDISQEEVTIINKATGKEELINGMKNQTLDTLTFMADDFKELMYVSSDLMIIYSDDIDYIKEYCSCGENLTSDLIKHGITIEE